MHNHLSIPAPAVPLPSAFAPAARMPSFMSAGLDTAHSLASLHLAVVGVGSIGLNVAMHASRLGVGRLLLCDPRRFKRESLITHPLSPEAIGRKKASYAGKLCRSINPASCITAFDGSIQALPLSTFTAVDLVLMATDNLAAEVATGDLCQNFSKPLIHCSVHGETLVAHAKLFRNASPNSPCPVCLFTDWELQQLHAATRFSCEGATQPAAASLPGQPPTMSPSFLCALSASLGMTLLLRHRLNLGQPVADTLLEHCGYTNRSVTSSLARRTDCPGSHSSHSLSSLNGPVGECSFRDLAEQAGFTSASSWKSVSFTIDGLHWVHSTQCQCPAPMPLRRFVKSAITSLGMCSKCGVSRLAQAFHTHRTVPAPLVRAWFDTPLRKLGAGKAGWAIVRGDEQSVFLSPASTTGQQP